MPALGFQFSLDVLGLPWFDEPIEKEDCASNKGLNVMPALSVFHTPPDATAMYHCDFLAGFTTISLILPETSAGPMLLNLSALKVDALANGLAFSIFFT